MASSTQFSSTHHAPQNKPLNISDRNLNKAYYDLAYGYYKKIRINPSLPLETNGTPALRQALTFIQYAIQLNVTTGSVNDAVENARNTDENTRFGRNDPKNWHLMARIVTALIAANGPSDPYHNHYQLTLLCARRNALTYARTVYDRDPNVKDDSFDAEKIMATMHERYQENWRDLQTFNALPPEATTYLLSHIIRYPYHNIFNVKEPGETERPPRRVDFQAAIREVMQQSQAMTMAPWLTPTYRASQFLHEAPRKDRIFNAIRTFDDPQLKHQALWQSLIKGTVLNALFSLQTHLQPVTYANDYYQIVMRELKKFPSNTSLRLDPLTLQALTADSELLTYLQSQQPTLFASLPPEVTAHMPAITQPPMRFMSAFMDAIHPGKAHNNEKAAPTLLLKPIGKQYNDI